MNVTLYGNKKNNQFGVYFIKVLKKIEDMKGAEVQTTESSTGNKACKNIYPNLYLYVYLLSLFLFTCRIRFVLSQTWQTLTKLIEKNNNIYNTKFVSLNPPAMRLNIVALLFAF